MAPTAGPGASASARATVPALANSSCLDADPYASLRGVVGEPRQHLADRLDTALQVKLGRIARGKEANDRHVELGGQVDPRMRFVQGCLPRGRLRRRQPNGGRQHR